ncbi:MAG: T9SS type A sorting domain-containing protein, partial [Ignavibacteria bacterium]
VFIHSIFSQTGWVQLNSGTFSNLNSVCFVDANTGYVVADSGSSVGIIFKTSDGGSSWIRLFSGNNALTSVSFPNANTGFVCGSGNYGGHVLFKTTNGGTNWIGGSNYDSLNIFTVYFINSLTGFQAGNKYIIKAYVIPCLLRTTDGGLSWNRQFFTYPPQGSLTSVFFSDTLNGYTQGSGYFYKTTNSGISWTQITSTGISNSIYFINNLTGWSSGNSFVYKTTNGGSNWSSISVSGTLYSVWFVNDQLGWVCGSGGEIYGTINGGTNWTLQSSGSTTNLFSLSFINSQTGWAVGAFGRILKTTNGGITNIQPISNEIPEEFKLYQNYPNPFNPISKIKFQISKLSNAKLSIFDIPGRQIVVLINEELKPGKYEIEWNGISYPSGVYFYKLEAGDYSETRKALLLK